MLKKLRIQNFKGWQDTGTIDMAPLTLFFGTNSSGKSSIGQFLMMLKQTVESSDRQAVLYTGGKNSAVNLGSYQEMIFQRDIQNKFAFEYQWEVKENLRFEDTRRRNTEPYQGSVLNFESEIRFANSPRIERIAYKLLEGENESLYIELKKLENKKDYILSARPYDLVKIQGRSWPLRNTVRFYGFSDEIVSRYQNAEFLQILNLEQEKLFNSIYYLGPLRSKAERLYPWSGIAPGSVGFEGENTIAAILAGQNRKISRGHKKKYYPLHQVIAKSLQKMELIRKFEINQISDRHQEYEVKVCAKNNDDEVDLLDIGFGISQVLPVLVQCYYAPRNSIIFMEQPELHLHPKAQSALADVIIDIINSKEDGQARNIQLVIETHSEHFLRRLQRRIAEGDNISKDQLSVYFAEVVNNKATMRPLEIDTFGNILNWPSNFFGDEMEDIIAQSKAALSKHSDQSA